MAHHLVIQLARFGDVVQTKRLLLSLAAVPGDVVHLAVDASLAPLARKVYPFAVVHALRAHAAQGGPTTVLAANREAFAALAAVPFASVYNLNFSGMSMAVAGLFDPDAVRGYVRRKGQVIHPPWMRMAFRWMGNRRMAPVNLVDFWAYLHPAPVRPATVNPPAATDTKNAKGKIAVVAAGREARRSLPAQVLAPLVESAFTARGGPEIIILGSNAERSFARRFSRLVRPAVLQKIDNACGRTDLADLPEILASCDLVLTPDTGIMHLAAHLGIPVRAFFLSSAWCFETGPYGEGHTVFQAMRFCAPCLETRPCPHATACLASFAEPGFAKLLPEDDERGWPEDIVMLRTAHDAFGCDCIPVRGVYPEWERKQHLRALLTEHVGCGSGSTAAWCAETIFHETDWMLPPVMRAGTGE